MSKTDLDLTVALLEDRRKELIHDPRLIFREKEGGNRRAAGVLDIVESNHSIPALLTNISMPARSQIPMKSVLFSTSVTSRCCSASARLRSVISRTILDAPITAPSASLMGEIVSDTEIRCPSDR